MLPSLVNSGNYDSSAIYYNLKNSFLAAKELRSFWEYFSPFDHFLFHINSFLLPCGLFLEGPARLELSLFIEFGQLYVAISLTFDVSPSQ